jgi:hypothetical protein
MYKNFEYSLLGNFVDFGARIDYVREQISFGSTQQQAPEKFCVYYTYLKKIRENKNRNHIPLVI